MLAACSHRVQILSSSMCASRSTSVVRSFGRLPTACCRSVTVVSTACWASCDRQLCWSDCSTAALVVDEFGDVEGLVSLMDVTESIVGDLPPESDEEPMIVRRDDGSWLLDGGLDLDAVVRALDAQSLLSATDRQHYHTLGGLAMLALGRVPRISDVFERGGYRFEIIDMDGNRVDRVLVSRTASTRVSGNERSGPEED